MNAIHREGRNFFRTKLEGSYIFRSAPVQGRHFLTYFTQDVSHKKHRDSNLILVTLESKVLLKTIKTSIANIDPTQYELQCDEQYKTTCLSRKLKRYNSMVIGMM
jgi:hypothetical protein